MKCKKIHDCFSGFIFLVLLVFQKKRVSLGISIVCHVSIHPSVSRLNNVHCGLKF